MANSEVTKLRIKADRARRTLDAVEKAAQLAVYQARRAWEDANSAYLDAAERAGLCRICLRPKSEGNHDGADHILIAMGGPADDCAARATGTPNE